MTKLEKAQAKYDEAMEAYRADMTSEEKHRALIEAGNVVNAIEREIENARDPVAAEQRRIEWEIALEAEDHIPMPSAIGPVIKQLTGE